MNKLPIERSATLDPIYSKTNWKTAKLVAYRRNFTNRRTAIAAVIVYEEYCLLGCSTV
jgi:hypothetical protein